jgi:hypothetical protein
VVLEAPGPTDVLGVRVRQATSQACRG